MHGGGDEESDPIAAMKEKRPHSVHVDHEEEKKVPSKRSGSEPPAAKTTEDVVNKVETLGSRPKPMNIKSDTVSSDSTTVPNTAETAQNNQDVINTEEENFQYFEKEAENLVVELTAEVMKM